MGHSKILCARRRSGRTAAGRLHAPGRSSRAGEDRRGFPCQNALARLRPVVVPYGHTPRRNAERPNRTRHGRDPQRHPLHRKSRPLGGALPCMVVQDQRTEQRGVALCSTRQPTAVIRPSPASPGGDTRRMPVRRPRQPPICREQHTRQTGSPSHRPLAAPGQRHESAAKKRPRAAFLNRSGSLPHSAKQPLPDARPRPTSSVKRSIACPDASSPFFLPSC